MICGRRLLLCKVPRHRRARSSSRGSGGVAHAATGRLRPRTSTTSRFGHSAANIESEYVDGGGYGHYKIGVTRSHGKHISPLVSNSNPRLYVQQLPWRYPWCRSSPCATRPAADSELSFCSCAMSLSAGPECGCCRLPVGDRAGLFGTGAESRTEAVRAVRVRVCGRRCGDRQPSQQGPCRGPKMRRCLLCSALWTMLSDVRPNVRWSSDRA